MRTAAGRVVEAVDLDDPQEAVLLGRAPQRDLADPLLGHEVGLDLAVLADDGVGPVLDPVEVGVGEGLQADLEGRNFGSHVEGQGLALEELPEGLGQDVLARVLLHVVEPRRPIDRAVNAAFGNGALDDVEDGPVEIEDRDNLGAAERALVPGLSARLGIEGRPVEDDGRTALVLAPLDDLGLELEKTGVVIIELLGLGHRDSPL